MVWKVFRQLPNPILQNTTSPYETYRFQAEALRIMSIWSLVKARMI